MQAGTETKRQVKASAAASRRLLGSRPLPALWAIECIPEKG
uniref:Uncharacterized protein n=1 Tax=Faecalibaculum rodentium TaxID=1702221 RepID=A0A140DTK8_9FIRM|nr:hypothetical protein AALO17_08510 [Faecalibaculum rodentium]